MSKDPLRERALARISERARAEFASGLARHEGRRLSVFLAILCGEAEPDPMPTNRRVHRRMYVPGLTAKPYWPAECFSLAPLLRRRFPLLREEAARLLAKPGTFRTAPGEAHMGDPSIDGGRLRGVWNAWYLQRYFTRQALAAVHTPVALRSLDGIQVSREALFSVVGPRTHITLHSDELNFVITLYMPLIVSPGAWIDFDRQPREWQEGEGFAADSTFLHESINATSLWRVILIVDLWHPELTEFEVKVLSTVMPLADAAMRGRFELID